VKVVQTTEASADSLSATVDLIYGWPQPGVRVGGGGHVTMPPTWNGQGATPPGWTKRQDAVWLKSASDCWYPMPDNIVALAAASGNLTGPQKASIASAGAGRVDVPDLTQGLTRNPKPESAVAVEAAAVEEANP
jgi:hypothetical protein